ncbi:DUF4118 domain-containing protein [Kocuria rhizophila]|nr:DUF4118 domain-containing protein [Kocuria rhizophila]
MTEGLPPGPPAAPLPGRGAGGDGRGRRRRKRAPDITLVDELAHTNAPGSAHEKRWEDVQQPARGGDRRDLHGERAADRAPSTTWRSGSPARPRGDAPGPVPARRAPDRGGGPGAPGAAGPAEGAAYPAERVDAALSRLLPPGQPHRAASSRCCGSRNEVDQALAAPPPRARHRRHVGGPGARRRGRPAGRGRDLLRRAGWRARPGPARGARDRAGRRARRYPAALAQQRACSWRSSAGPSTRWWGMTSRLASRPPGQLRHAAGAGAPAAAAGSPPPSRVRASGPRSPRSPGDRRAHGRPRAGGRARVHAPPAGRCALRTTPRSASWWRCWAVRRRPWRWPGALPGRHHERRARVPAAVVVVALVGGIWPALFAAVLSGLTLDYLHPPVDTITIADPAPARANPCTVIAALA